MPNRIQDSRFFHPDLPRTRLFAAYRRQRIGTVSIALATRGLVGNLAASPPVGNRTPPRSVFGFTTVFTIARAYRSTGFLPMQALFYDFTFALKSQRYDCPMREQHDEAFPHRPTGNRLHRQRVEPHLRIVAPRGLFC